MKINAGTILVAVLGILFLWWGINRIEFSSPELNLGTESVELIMGAILLCLILLGITGVFNEKHLGFTWLVVGLAGAFLIGYLVFGKEWAKDRIRGEPITKGESVNLTPSVSDPYKNRYKFEVVWKERLPDGSIPAGAKSEVVEILPLCRFTLPNLDKVGLSAEYRYYSNKWLTFDQRNPADLNEIRFVSIRKLDPEFKLELPFRCK